MKTIREWLEELPEPYRTQALENAEITVLSELPLARSLRKALLGAFIWGKSPQGFDYWERISHGEYYL